MYIYITKSTIKYLICIADTSTLGRPTDSKVDEAMELIYNFMDDSDDCQFTFNELKANLSEYIPDDKTIKCRLQQHYGNDVIISTKSTSQTLVCLRRSHYDVLSEMYKQSASAGNEEEQKLNILKAAADIIRSDIRSITNDFEQYPASDKMFNDLDASIPNSLQLFLEELILKYKKSNSNYHKIKCF